MIYFDNGATTYPKPRSVLNVVNEAVSQYSFNSGRGGYKESLKAAEKIFSVRENLSLYFLTSQRAPGRLSRELSVVIS